MPKFKYSIIRCRISWVESNSEINVAFGIYPSNPFYLVLNLQSSHTNTLVHKRTDKSTFMWFEFKKTFLSYQTACWTLKILVSDIKLWG